MNKEETLAAYIKKLLDLKDEQLSEEHLREMALELGLTEADYEELQEEYRDHVTRAQGFVNFLNYEDAIGEYKQAIALNPLKVEGLLGASHAYRAWWEQDKKNWFHEQALIYARKALDVDASNQEALRIIGELKQNKHAQSKKVMFWGAIGAVVLAVFIYFSLDMEKLPSQDQQPSPGPSVQEEVESVAYFSSFQVPIRLLPHPGVEFELLPTMSNIQEFATSYSYKLQGRIRVKQGDLKKISMQAHMIRQNGERVFHRGIKVYDHRNSGARAGDLLGWGMTYFEEASVPNDIKEVQLQVNDISTSPPLEAYPDSKKQSLIWKVEKLPEVDLKLKIRNHKVQVGNFFPNVTICYELSNTGQVPIEMVQLKTIWKDKKNREVFSGTQFLASSNMAPLPAGETYIAGRIFGLDGADGSLIDHFEVEVVKLKVTD